MFAYRWTWIVKSGRMEELLELHKTLSFRPDYAKYRIYTPDTSPYLFVGELVVESEEAMNKWFTEFYATPEAEAFWEKWRDLMDRRVSTERWQVMEIG